MKRAAYRFVVVGAGVSGLASAYVLAKSFPGEVAVLEKAPQVGGLCRRVQRNQAIYDLGSHRIHAQTGPRILDLIREVTPGLLIKNIRGGRLKLEGTYIDYPITSVQMFRALGLHESARCAVSLAKSRTLAQLGGKIDPAKLNYESYLRRGAGDRAYALFYEPYARKVWGCEPARISVTAVKKRVSMSGPMEFLKDIVSHHLGHQDPKYYYYLKEGVGALPEALDARLRQQKTTIVTGADVTSITADPSRVEVRFLRDGKEESITAGALISTIPIDELVRLLGLEASLRDPLSRLEWTGLRIAYLHFDRPPLLDGETFYFPELRYPFGRVSVPSRFSRALLPEGMCGLVCEVPWGARREMVQKPDAEIFDLCLRGLREAGLIDPSYRYLSEKSFIIDLDKVYPVYVTRWDSVLSTILTHLAGHAPRVFASGRPGFFLHNNLDHSIEIGFHAAEHVLQGKNAALWYDRALEFHGMKLRD